MKEVQTQTLSSEDLQHILTGAAVIACGGGGPIEIGQEIINYFHDNKQVVKLIDPNDFDSDSWACVSAFEGSPNAATALTAQDVSDAANAAFLALGKNADRNYSAVMPGEVGAGNSFVPMMVAAKQGIPVLDVDGAGRAIPSLTQVTYASHHVPVSPMVVGNSENVVTLTVETVELAEQISREIVSAADFGEDGGLAFWSMQGDQMRDASIHNTMSYAMKLGEALDGSIDPVQTVINYLDGAKLLFVGKIEEVIEATSGGFDTGRLIIKDSKGKRFIIYNQNENLIAWHEDQTSPVIIAPDMISFIATDGTTFTNADPDLAKVKGKEIAVIGSKARAKLRDNAYTINAFMKTLRNLGYGGKHFYFD